MTLVPPSDDDIQGQTHDSDGIPCFVCPCCSKRSYHPVDREQGYCGRCSWWTGNPAMPDCSKHALENTMPICPSCKSAADTGEMTLHGDCPGGTHCACQHRSTDEYPTEKHISGNVDLTDTPVSGVKDVRNF